MVDRYRTDDLVVDLRRMEAIRGGAPLELPGLTFDMLVCLLQRAPAVVSHDELVEQVWNGEAISDETITQRISLLRRALGDDPVRPRYILTSRGRGYRWLLPVHHAPEAPAPVPRSRLRSPRLRSMLLATGSAIAGLTLFLVLGASPRGDGPFDALSGTAPSASELISRGRIYLARHRELDNELAAELFHKALRDPGSQPSARIGLSLALSQRATKFNGSLAWAEDAERLARESLVLAPEDADGHHALGLALDAQGRVSAALTAYRRAVALDPGHTGAIASAAYLLYVRGELAEALRWNLRALALGEETPYLELQFAEILGALDYHLAADDWYRRALTMRPDSVFAHGAYARYRLERGDLAGAEALAEQALARGIRRPEPFMILGHAAWIRGREEVAREKYRLAAALNPRQSSARAYLAALEGSPASPLGREGPSRCAAWLQSDGDEWPQRPLMDALHCGPTGRSEQTLEALDRAIDLGFRDVDWLVLHPAFARLRQEDGFEARVARVRGLVAAERQLVDEALWMPKGWLADSA